MADAMSITRRIFLKVAPAAAIATPVLVSGADAAPMAVSLDLAGMIEKHRQLTAAYHKVAVLLDEDDPAGLELIDGIAQECGDLMMDIARFTARSAADRRAKGEYLLVRAGDDPFWVDRELYVVFLQSLANEA